MFLSDDLCIEEYIWFYNGGMGDLEMKMIFMIWDSGCCRSFEFVNEIRFLV